MRSVVLKPQSKLAVKVALILFAVTILAMVYLFQRIDLVSVAVGEGSLDPYFSFVVNRVLRLIVNDLACFVIIYSLFEEKKYLKLAFWVFLVELLVILPLYLIVKLSTEGDSEISSPLLSQVHRLVVNPTLMILLIGGFFYQKIKTGRSA